MVGDLGGAVEVPVQVRAMVSAFLREVDDVAPGVIEMFYLVGSVALDDYRPGISDIDFVAVTSRDLDDDDLVYLAEIHQAMPKFPHFDGIYLDRDALAKRPDDGEVVPHSVNGQFHADQPCGELNPTSWLTLKQCGLTVRGPSPAELAVDVDPNRLRTWNLDNLRSYWQPLAGWIRSVMNERDDDHPAQPEGVMWAVLGPARLHYTLATGAVTTKTGAGAYAAEHFPQWSHLAELAAACRSGGPVEFATPDALAAADMIEAVVDDAWRRWG